MKSFIRILGMKKKHIILYTAAAICTALCTSCSDYLDKMPDNRATVDTEEKITSLLVSAYPNSHYALIAEMSSDNTEKRTFLLYRHQQITRTGSSMGRHHRKGDG